MISKVQRIGPKQSERRGVATVELAVVLPIMLIFAFGTIELTQRLQTRQSTVIAAYEACRVATRPASDTERVLASCETLLKQQDVKGTTVEVRNMTQRRNNLDEVATGDQIRVRIDVEWRPNVVSRYVVKNLGKFRTEAFMLRE